MRKRKFMDAWLIKLVRSGSLGCSEMLTQFVREVFLKALLFGVCSFGHIFRSDQLCYQLFIFKVSNIGKCFCRATHQKSHLHNKSREIILDVYSVL